MGRQAKIVLLIVGLAGILAVCGYLGCGWTAARMMLGTEESFERQNMTVTEARGCVSVPLPDEASDISFYGYRCWQAVNDNLRFHAPQKVCLSHLKTIFDDWAKSGEFHKVDAAATQPTTITRQERPRPPSNTDHSATRRGDSDRAWFNPDDIRNGVHAGGGPHTPEVWVDLDRGIFYYRMTD